MLERFLTDEVRCADKAVGTGCCLISYASKRSLARTAVLRHNYWLEYQKLAVAGVEEPGMFVSQGLYADPNKDHLTLSIALVHVANMHT
jgi:hypothetical protein